MKAKDVMTKSAASLPQNATLREVIDRFVKYHIDALPILDAAERVVGFITVQQLADLFLPKLDEMLRDFSALEDKGQLAALFEGSFLGFDESAEKLVLAADMMASKLRWVGQDDSLLQAASILRTQGYACLPVIDRDQKLMGLISDFDVILALLKGSAVESARA